MKKVIPTVDVSKFIKGDAAQKAAFVEELGAAFSTVGFVGIVNHGVSQTLIDDFYK
jgi:isopenicillin N synthase-like dioxygenase